MTLAKSDKLTAQTIHDLCGVPRPDVYRVLGELEEAGLVEKIISKPENFHAILIEECLSILLQRRIIKTHRLQKEALKLTHAFARKTACETPQEKAGFTLISGRDAVYAKSEKMIRSAQDRICILGLPRRMLAWLSYCPPVLEEALARNVDCRIILAKPRKDALLALLKRLGKHANFRLKLILDKPQTGFSVCDQKEALITTSAIDTSTPAPALWSNNKSIVDLCQEHFELLWQKAEKTDFNA